MKSTALLVACAFLASLLTALPASADAWDEASAAAERSARMQRAEQARVAADREELAKVQRELEAQPDAYEANYDLAYLHWRQGQLHYTSGNDSERKRRFDLAQEYVERALEQRPDDLEARILLSGTLNSLAGEGMFARVRYGQKSFAVCVENHERAPENPRALLQRGLMYFFAPAAFGGDLEAAERVFRAAHTHFSQAGEPREWPSWGALDSAAWLGQALAKSGRVVEARGVYREALAANPESRWIREQLLPGLDGPVAARD